MFKLSISENILLFLIGFGTLQGILLALLIYFHPRSDRSVNFFLALYIGSLSIIMSSSILHQLMSWHNSFFLEPFNYLPGPLMYLYIRSFKERITWQKAFPHLLFFFLYFIIAYFLFSYFSKKYPDVKEIPEEVFQHPITNSLILIRYIQFILYYILSYRALISYQKSIQHIFSETSRINLGWVRWLINGYIFLIAATIVIYMFMVQYPEKFYLLFLINIALCTPYIYLITFKGITQPSVWQTIPGTKKETVEEEMEEAEKIEIEISKHEQPKYQKPGLADGRIDEISVKLLAIMENDKLYQEPELTLQDLADRLQFPPHQVSLGINEGLKKNFYDLINGYRVEEAKRLLLDPKSINYTILSIGFEAGFNSKTTFNTVFKKFTGLTPSDFRIQQKTPVLTT